MTDLTPQEQSTVTMVLEAARELRAEDSGLETVAKRARTLKELGAFVVGVVTIVVIGTVTVLELRAKPTVEQVDTAVEAKIAPVRTQAKDTKAMVDGIKLNMESVTKDVARVKQVQDYQLEQSAWQGEVVDHLAQKKKGKPKAKPESLKAKERELIK